MTKPLVIVGCGGFGREVMSILQASTTPASLWKVEGFVDDDPSSDSVSAIAAFGSEIIGKTSDLAERRLPYYAVLAIGDPGIRRRVHLGLARSPVLYPTIIHPDTTIGSLVTIGDGVVIAPGARISTNVTVGAHVHVDQNVTIGHDTTIGDFSRLNPQACISGSTHLGRGVLIGASATVLQGLTIGDGAVVGAGACVVKHVAPATVVKGVPAR